MLCVCVREIVCWKDFKLVFDFTLDFVVDQMQAVKFALDIACGMAFLHTLEPMIPRHYLNSKSVMVSVKSAQNKSFLGPN